MKPHQLLVVFFASAVLAVSLFISTTIIDAQTETPATRTETSTPSPTPSPSPKATFTPRPPTEETEIYKVETELVNLNVRVVDRNGRPINGLRQEEFKIMEDGAPQSIEFFSKAEVPTNYGLVIDNSGSLRAQLEKIIEAGKILIGSNKTEDETMIIRFVDREKITIEQPFTANKTDLNDALDNLYIEGGHTAIIDAIYLAADKVTEYEKSRKADDDRKRRALVVITDGEDRDSYYNEAQLFELLRELDVQIFPIGFVGDLSKEKGLISKSPQGKAKAFLERLATETGGRAYFPASVGELAGIAKDIGNELRVQYSIGYIPTNDRKDGTFRNIKVAIADGPNKEKRIAVTKAGRIAEGGATQQTNRAPK